MACCVSDSFPPVPPFRCEDRTVEVCEGVGGTFHDFPCEFFDCAPFPDGGPLGACCIGDGCEIVGVIECGNLGGEYQGDGVGCDEACGEEPPVPVCRPAPVPRKPPTPWSPNLCHNAMLGVEVNPETRDGSIRTLHRMRAFEPDPADPMDPCAFHRGDMMIDTNGDAVGVMCYQPERSRAASRESSIARHVLVTQARGDPNLFVQPGDAYFAAVYRGPMVTEARLHSHKHLCEEIR